MYVGSRPSYFLQSTATVLLSFFLTFSNYTAPGWVFIPSIRLHFCVGRYFRSDFGGSHVLSYCQSSRCQTRESYVRVSYLAGLGLTSTSSYCEAYILSYSILLLGGHGFFLPFFCLYCSFNDVWVLGCLSATYTAFFDRLFLWCTYILSIQTVVLDKR